MPAVSDLALLFVIGLLAFTTEGAMGFGGTVIAVSLGAQMFAIDALLPAFVPINMALSAYLLISALRDVAWPILLKVVAPPVVVGVAVGLALFRVAASLWLQLAFGVFVAALAVIQLRQLYSSRSDPDHSSATPSSLAYVKNSAFLVTGGIIHGLFATGGPMIVYVVGRLIVDKRAFRASLAVLWLTLNIALVINYQSADKFTSSTWYLGAALAASLLPGAWLGELLHRKLDPRRFARMVWWLLLIASAVLAVRTGWKVIG
jgi:uncharacterized protein